MQWLWNNSRKLDGLHEFENHKCIIKNNINNFSVFECNFNENMTIVTFIKLTKDLTLSFLTLKFSVKSLWRIGWFVGWYCVHGKILKTIRKQNATNYVSNILTIEPVKFQRIFLSSNQGSLNCRVARYMFWIKRHMITILSKMLKTCTTFLNLHFPQTSFFK